MSIKPIFIVIIITILAFAGFFAYRTFYSPIPSASPLSSPTPISVKIFSDSNIKFTASGDFDTSNWGTYQSDVSGFKVKSPMEGEYIETQKQLRDLGERSDALLYGVSNEYGIAVEIIPRELGDTLDNWFSKYITRHSENIANIKFITTGTGNYRALQFDTKDFDDTMPSSVEPIMITPTGFRTGGGGTSLQPNIRYIIIDGGFPDRFGSVSFPLPAPEHSYYLDLYYKILSTFEMYQPTGK